MIRVKALAHPEPFAPCLDSPKTEPHTKHLETNTTLPTLNRTLAQPTAMIWDSDDNMLSDPSGSVGANATVAVSGGDGMIPKFEVDVEGGNGEVELGLEQEQKNKEKGKEVREAVDTHSLARLATDSTIPKEEVKSLFGSSIFGGESGGEESQGYATNTSLLLGNWSSEVFGSTYSWVSQSAAPQMVMASSG